MPMPSSNSSMGQPQACPSDGPARALTPTYLRHVCSHAPRNSTAVVPRSTWTEYLAPFLWSIDRAGQRPYRLYVSPCTCVRRSFTWTDPITWRRRSVTSMLPILKCFRISRTLNPPALSDEFFVCDRRGIHPGRTRDCGAGIKLSAPRLQHYCHRLAS